MKSRLRRSAADARQQILDAAERRLLESGPGGIRLKEVAADVGVSHPTILHHFGSREELVRAVVDRAILGLEADLLLSLEDDKVLDSDSTVLFDRMFERLFGRGHARLIAWLLLTGYEPFGSEAARAGWAKITKLTHSLRVERSEGKDKPTLEDTRFTIVLSALALFGQAIAGKDTFALAGFGKTPRVEKRFRAWFASLIGKHLEE